MTDPRETSARRQAPEQRAPTYAGDATRPSSQEDQRGGVFSLSFLGLLATQLLGAANDNAFRLLAIGVCEPLMRKHRPELAFAIIPIGLACFTLPYLLLAAPAGYLADRFSKRRVIVGCKLAEIVLMLLAVGGARLGAGAAGAAAVVLDGQP